MFLALSCKGLGKKWSDVAQIVTPRSPDLPSFVESTTLSSKPDMLRSSLETQLFASPSLQSLRFRLALAEFCSRLTEDAEVRLKFELLTRDILERISTWIYWVFVKHMLGMTATLTERDVLFCSRVVARCRTPNKPDWLQNLATKLFDALTSTDKASSRTNDLHQNCPACGVPVEQQDETLVKCISGHVWALCSITQSILCNERVRTCSGCGRKALLPPSQSPAEAPIPTRSQNGKNGLFEEALEAARSCLYCGNRFIRLI